MPGYAQKKNLPKALKNTAKSNTAFQAALRHAESLRLADIQRMSAPFAKARPRNVRTVCKNAPKKTPQQWLDELERYMAQNDGKFPTLATPQSKTLYSGVSATLSRLDPQDPIALRIRQLRAQSPRKPRGNPPAFWMDKLEAFIAKNGYFPRPSSTGEEKEIYTAAHSLVARLRSENPDLVQHIRELKAQFPYSPK